MERSTFKVLFYLKRAKRPNNQDIPIIMRITVNRQRVELSTHREVDPEKWDQAKGRVTSTSPWARELNDYLSEKYFKAHKIRKNLEEKDLPVTAIAIRNALQGITDEKTGVLEVFDDHNKKCQGIHEYP